MYRIGVFIVAACVLSLGAEAGAQTGRVTGRVIDTQGAAIVNAVVTLVSAAGSRAESRTAGDGGFVFPGVSPGAFTVQVDAAGFIRWSQPVNVSATSEPLNITLRVAGVREAVSVVGVAPVTLETPAATSSRLGLTPLETPASVFIMTGDAIRERGDRTVADAKTRAVGITMQGNPGNGGNGAAARGFVDTGSVMQLFDGDQMLVGASTVTFPFDPWIVERIEVLNGPSGVLYGNGAIGGVVNIVPRRPNPSLPQTTMRVGAGSFRTWRGAMDSTGPVGGKTSYRVAVSGNGSNGWIAGNDSSNVAFTASLRHEVRPNLSVTVSEDFGYQQPGEYFGTPTINGRVDQARRDVNYNVSDADIWFRDSWTQARVEWQPSANVRVRNGVRVLAAGRHFAGVEQYVYNPATNLIQRDSYFEAFHRQRQYGDRVDVTISSRPFGRSNTLAVGVDYDFVSFQHTNNSPFGGSSVTDLRNSTPGQFINLAGTLPKYRTHTHQTAIFAEDRLVVAPTVSLVGGLRVDRSAVERRNLLDDSVIERSYTPVSWRGGVVYSAKPSLSVYGQVATASATIRNIISSNPGQLLFDPTLGRQVEVGVKQSLGAQRVEWTLAGYHITKSKIVVPVPGLVGVAQQVGEQSSRGIEATAAINLPVGLRIDANLAVLRARFDDFSENVGGVLTSRVGNTPPSVPERSGNLWLSWSAPSAWQFRGGLRSVSRRYWDNANAFSIPAYTVIDAGVRKALTPRVAVDLFLFNLTDALYATDFYFNGFAPQWMLGTPRSAEVSLTVAF